MSRATFRSSEKRRRCAAPMAPSNIGTSQRTISTTLPAPPAKPARLHIYTGAGEQAYTWKTQKGFLATPSDIRNQEFTAFVRVHGIVDPKRAAITLKIRGGAHSANNPDLASCTMMTFQAASTGAVARFRQGIDSSDLRLRETAAGFRRGARRQPMVRLETFKLRHARRFDPRRQPAISRQRTLRTTERQTAQSMAATRRICRQRRPEHGAI